MSEGDKRLVHRLHELWSRGDLRAVEDVYATDFVAHFPSSSEFPERPGLDWVRRGIERIRTAFPDWREDVDELVAEGDRVVSRYTSRGTHRGAFWGIPPTGRRVEVAEISIFRIAGGRVAEQWCLVDELGRLQDLGAAPRPWTPAGAPAPKRRRPALDGPEPAPPARVMSIHAHPDDQEFTVAGTLAKWARAGSSIVTVCITSGAGGSNEHTPADMTREALAPVREQEQRNACRVLGISEVVFLRHEDGMLTPSLELRRELTRLIRRYRPDAIVCGDPTVRFYGTTYLNHPDHRAAADVALDAVFPSAETRLIFPELVAEGLAPHHVSAVFLHGSRRPDTFVDIADLLNVKLAALREHQSQMGTWDPTEMITGWARLQGKPRGLRAAEAFRRMTLDR